MRVVLGIGVVIVAVVLLIVLKGGGESSNNGTTTAGRTPLTTIVVGQNAKPVGGIADISLNEGEEVRFKVESAVADEVHMHGYEIGKNVKAGGTVTFEFPATIEGVFEAELESRKEQILELTVNP
jgi:hypothetical protein